MVRFSLAVQPEDEKKTTYLLPDKIEHRKYTPMPSGRGFWTLCWRDAVETMIRTGAPAPRRALHDRARGRC